MTTTAFPAIVTAAGAATRFQPFSSTVPKEMLPLGHIPAVEYVIVECLAAGASEVIVVTRPGDRIIPAHVRGLRADGLPVDTVEEDLSHGYGNATPLLTLRDRLATCEAFAVAFGDDILLGEQPRGGNLAAMREQMRPETEAIVAAQRIDPNDTRSFGIIDTDPEQGQRVTAIRQRPDPETVDEPLGVVSRLILRPSILDLLRPTELARGEVDLGIAVGQLAAEARVAVHRIAAHWVTVGDPRRYLDALHAYWNLNTPEPAATGDLH
ncbi:NTP transferase domain-containing protein [Saccharopolyspora sp. K220]|uniref:sugar phosphate nucleotidyltransferase n=1 Tax=Saccharopolyspora soli TaxID=2926618 RepID=UPI001F5A587A|nr:sugar phosphate nucleotidyltransferase [Saccharopolyspora soli]MCI2422140.1 NTP transferase domain-containing protein [Saccharopolyspora soli]